MTGAAAKGGGWIRRLADSPVEMAGNGRRHSVLWLLHRFATLAKAAVAAFLMTTEFAPCAFRAAIC
jgi:hypothetical protein